jgi:transcriptional regulator of arginine metabolism
VTAVSPVTKAARHAQIAGILEQNPVRSQEELAEWLARRGVRVTQTTLSRDLVELGAVRLRRPDGALVYALPDSPGGPGSQPGPLPGIEPQDGPASAVSDSTVPASTGPASTGPASTGPASTGPDGLAGRLARAAAELLVSAEASANLVVLRTPAGAAQYFASVLDHARWSSILGTVAGDDTVLVIARDPAGGADLAAALLRLAERRA